MLATERVQAQELTGIVCTVPSAVQLLQPVTVGGWHDIPPSLPGDSLGAVARLLSWQSCATNGRQAEVARLVIDAGGHVIRVTFDTPPGMQFSDAGLQRQVAALARQLRFRPAFRAGQPTYCQLLVLISAWPEGQLRYVR
ncbi:hypothetical protein EJV47_19860 [Hymenobacter gummosus]|uniref:TonB C-terminal domain-containing protein n=1 Tax=Hymenobacter gummosus TaxID=1776032 RepID=A0A3S0JEQ6_9BACT|nr:hypothetical protein [Hymenobacter gummosus]RTQ47155.1 hypothetical protein EJV47_19860 [Hymenobacter gummosus]